MPQAISAPLKKNPNEASSPLETHSTESAKPRALSESYLTAIFNAYSRAIEDQTRSAALSRSGSSLAELSQLAASKAVSDQIKTSGMRTFFGKMGGLGVHLGLKAAGLGGIADTVHAFASAGFSAFGEAPDEARLNSKRSIHTIKTERSQTARSEWQQTKDSLLQLGARAQQAIQGVAR